MKQAPAPGSPRLEALLDEALALETAGRHVDAAALYRRVQERAPAHPRALAGLGRILDQRGNALGAVPLFERALKVRPKDAGLHVDFAIVLLHLGRPDRAEPHILTALRIDKNSVEALRTAFDCYSLLGRVEKAEPYLKRALKLRPDDARLRLALAQFYEMTGRTADARELFQVLVDQDEPVPAALYGLAQVQKFSVEPSETAKITTLLQRSDLAPRDRAYLYQAEAKIAEDLGRFDAAFASYAAASAAEPRPAEELVGYDKRVARTKEIITPAFFAERAGHGDSSRRPVFVFGMPRSGTTLVEQIIGTHPKAFGAGELPFFGLEITQLGGWAPTAADIGRIARDYLKLLSAYSRSAERVVDKMPQNFDCLWLMALAFPNASFIHCRRDPVATCVSCFTRPLTRTHHYVADLGRLGRYYRQYSELMEHWKAVLPVEIVTVDYERMVADPETEIRRLIDAVGLEWDAACLRFHETRRLVRTPSRRQVEQPIYRTGLDAWRRYEMHLEPLFDALGPLAETARNGDPAAGVTLGKA